jgi:hypothetical protein
MSSFPTVLPDEELVVDHLDLLAVDEFVPAGMVGRATATADVGRSGGLC